VCFDSAASSSSAKSAALDGVGKGALPLKHAKSGSLDLGWKMNIDFSAKDDAKGMNLLCHACYHGHYESANTLLAFSPIEARTQPEGRSALHLACANGHIRVVQLLLDKGANIHAVDIMGTTCMHVAAAGNHIEILKLLHSTLSSSTSSSSPSLNKNESGSVDDEKNGVSDSTVTFETLDRAGMSPLRFAARGGHLESVIFLLDIVGVNIDPQPDDSYVREHTITRSAVIDAAIQGHTEVVQALIQRKANLSCVQYQDGWSALLFAASKGHTETVSALLEGGASFTYSDPQHYSPPISWAAKSGHLETVKVLLEFTAAHDPDLARSRAWFSTVRSDALEAGHLSTVSYLDERYKQLLADAESTTGDSSPVAEVEYEYLSSDPNYDAKTADYEAYRGQNETVAESGGTGSGPDEAHSNLSNLLIARQNRGRPEIPVCRTNIGNSESIVRLDSQHISQREIMRSTSLKKFGTATSFPNIHRPEHAMLSGLQMSFCWAAAAGHLELLDSLYQTKKGVSLDELCSSPAILESTILSSVVSYGSNTETAKSNRFRRISTFTAPEINRFQTMQYGHSKRHSNLETMFPAMELVRAITEGDVSDEEPEVDIDGESVAAPSDIGVEDNNESALVDEEKQPPSISRGSTKMSRMSSTNRHGDDLKTTVVEASSRQDDRMVSFVCL